MHRPSTMREHVTDVAAARNYYLKMPADVPEPLRRDQRRPTEVLGALHVGDATADGMTSAADAFVVAVVMHLVPGRVRSTMCPPLCESRILEFRKVRHRNSENVANGDIQRRPAGTVVQLVRVAEIADILGGTPREAVVSVLLPEGSGRAEDVPQAPEHGLGHGLIEGAHRQSGSAATVRGGRWCGRFRQRVVEHAASEPMSPTTLPKQRQRIRLPVLLQQQYQKPR
mmetsp:Transcript_89480/g.286752  ORF Transcript_89480/g.286752 Transcript_89480/m.286752 type:complete len:227 (-) Transcript_89480:696-1376(-)